MEERVAIEKMSERLRIAMGRVHGDLEAAVKMLLEANPEDGELLRQVIAGAQSAQARHGGSPEFKKWLAQAVQNPRVKHLASTIGGLSSRGAGQVLAGIAKKRPDLAEALKNAVFQLDDLEFADKKGIETLVNSLDRQVLLKALRGLDEPIKTQLLKGLSARNRKDVIAELEWMNPVRRRDVDEARQEVVVAARKLLERGKMFLMRPNDPDPYIE